MKKNTLRAAVFALTLSAPLALAQSVVEPTEAEQSVLFSILISALPYILGVLSAAAVWALGALAVKLGREAGGSKVKLVLQKAVLLTETVVADINVTVKPLVVKASADGRITSAEAKEIKDAAMKRLLEVLGDKGLKELQAVLGLTAGTIGVFLGGLIEKAVDALKAGKALSKPAVVAMPQGLTAGAVGSTAALAGVTTLP
jgi:hypothetical protein